MSENAKTVTFVVVGMLAVAVGLLSRPSSAEMDEASLVGSDLTKAFQNVEDAKRLRIVRVDEDTATRSEFDVAEQGGLWTIPSKDGYPADAAAQMAEAATSLMDRKILQVASQSAADHEEYGVVDPASPKLEPGQKGIGTRVTMFNEQQEPLVDLIVGKAVKGAEGQRYVREAGRDIVYVIEIDRSKLSTNFDDWIEKDLLKLDAWDLQQVEIKDYSAELVPVMTPDGQFRVRPTWDPRAQMTVAYNDTDAKWTPVKLQKFDPAGGQGEYVDFTLAEDEELNAESLNGLKSALDDLKIVDVERKPAGLSEDLKAGADFMNNREALQDLMSKGFTPAVTSEGGAEEIISSDGEVIATLKDGAEYVLRFGNLTNVSGIDQQEEGAAAAGADAAEAKKSGPDVHRYMFVMARHNKAAVKQPELDPLPELPAGEQAALADESKPAEPVAESSDAAAEPADAEKAEGEAAAESSEPAETAPPQGADATPEGEAAADAASTDAAKAESDDAADSGDVEETNAEQPAETPAGEAADATTGEKPADPAATDNANELEKIMAERKRIEQENQRKMDDYQALLKKGEEKVKELNLRFGDWYFVVDDEVFQKVRLSREDVIKKKAPPEAEGAAPGSQATPPAPPASATPLGLPEIPGATE